MRRSALGSLVFALGVALGTVPLTAQAIKVGGQLSFGDDSDFGIGPRAQVTLPRVASGLWLAASFDYFFPDSGLADLGGDYDYRELNVNVLGDLTIAGVTNLTPYIGGGVNVTWQSIPSDGADEMPERLFGLNVVAGLRFPLAGFTPFVEARYELEGGEQLLVAGGILLP